jgi:hypothetical protein
MSNFIYGKAKQAFLNGLIDISNDQIDIIFVGDGYVPSVNSDEFVSHIQQSNIKSHAINLANVSNTLGVIDANDVFVVQYSGGAFKAIVIFAQGTSAANSRLIAYIDTSEGLPFLGTNEPVDITIAWNNSVNKIISI